MTVLPRAMEWFLADLVKLAGGVPLLLTAQAAAERNGDRTTAGLVRAILLQRAGPWPTQP